MSAFLSYTIIGIFTGAAYAIAASGLVLTYSTTRIFNVAHGALAMVLSFVYWDISVRQGWPVWLSLAVVLLVLAPAFGVFIDRVLVRNLGNAPVSVSLVVTVGILVLLIGLATKVWAPIAQGRALSPFFDGPPITVTSDIVVTKHALVTMAVSAVVAAALYVLLTRTRIGTAMRASVDNPDLLRLYGGRPQLASSLAWAIGTSLAALAGILLAPVVGLDYYQLTLLVVSAYAAAMLGKLTSLPLTYVGAMGLGILQSYAIGYLNKIPGSENFPGLPAVMPTLFLFAILVLLPQAPLRIGQVKGIVAAPVPTLGRSGAWGVGLIGVVVLMALGMKDSNLLLIGTAIAYGIIMLSLVLLTGYGGYLSLAQLTFAGVGAVAYSKLDQPNLFGLLVAALIAAAAGALVAIPVLRLTGLYLALATLAFAQLADKLLFQTDFSYTIGNTLAARRLTLPGLSFESTGAFVVLMAVVFVAIAMMVIAIRRGRLGRVLIAMRDSQAACGTLGLDLRWMRVGLFAGSAGIAGVGGALLAGLRGSTVADDWMYFHGLVLVLAVVVWGVTSISGVVLGALFLMALNFQPGVLANYPSLQSIFLIVLGGGAIVIGRDPNGLANRAFGLPGAIMDRAYPALAERFPGLALETEQGARPEDAEAGVVLAGDDVDFEMTEEVASGVTASS